MEPHFYRRIDKNVVTGSDQQVAVPGYMLETGRDLPRERSFDANRGRIIPAAGNIEEDRGAGQERVTIVNVPRSVVERICIDRVGDDDVGRICRCCLYTPSGLVCLFDGKPGAGPVLRVYSVDCSRR